MVLAHQGMQKSRAKFHLSYAVRCDVWLQERDKTNRLSRTEKLNCCQILTFTGIRVCFVQVIWQRAIPQTCEALPRYEGRATKKSLETPERPDGLTQQIFIVLKKIDKHLGLVELKQILLFIKLRQAWIGTKDIQREINKTNCLIPSNR